MTLKACDGVTSSPRPALEPRGGSGIPAATRRRAAPKTTTTRKGTTMTTATPKLVRAWQSFAGPNGDVRRGEVLPADHELVRQAPDFFCDSDVPERDMPNHFGALADRAAEQARAEIEAAQAAFEAQAKKNPVRLNPRTVKAQRDFFAHIGGAPALVRKGSVALESDEIVRTYPEAGWK